MEPMPTDYDRMAKKLRERKEKAISMPFGPAKGFSNGPYVHDSSITQIGLNYAWISKIVLCA